MTNKTEILQVCQEWEESHSKIDSNNFLECFFEVIKTLGQDSDKVTVMRTIIESGKIKACIHCGRISGHPVDINGTYLDLCHECQEHVLYWPLGAQEGYV